VKILILLLPPLLGAVHFGPAGAAVTAPQARIAVVFEQPQHFTDVKYAKADHNTNALLGEFYTFMRKVGARYVPEDMQLEITITDIDLAGDFEPWRGPQFDHVRIIRAIYPPRISLTFRLADSSGQVVKAGTRVLHDIAYQTRLVRPLDDYLRYEKDMLRDWFRNEFRDLMTTPARSRTGSTEERRGAASYGWAAPGEHHGREPDERGQHGHALAGAKSLIGMQGMAMQ
jgi:hypothetical protein